MWPLLALILGGISLVLLLRLRYLRGTLRDLCESAERRKPYLLSEQPRLARHFHIRRLQEIHNRILSENETFSQSERDYLRQIEATLRSIQEAVFIVDASNSVVVANEAFTRSFAGGEDPTARRIEALLPGAPFLEYIQSIKRGETLPRQEIQVRLAGNATAWVEVSGSSLDEVVSENEGSPEDHRQHLTLFVLHDISRQKQLESIRSEFIANVSHELRTPLTVLKGFADTLVEDHNELSPADRERFLIKIKRNVERLNRLVEDLLILSRMEASPDSIEKKPEHLPKLIQEMADDYRHRPNPRGHTLEVQIAPAVSVVELDIVRINQVFENLLDNAFKYCRETSRIIVGARMSADGVLCFVEDNGPGIPEEDLPRVFERFYRVDKGRSRESGGTGLGLSIVKHIIQQHGGTVRCRSRVGEGTRFEFLLPLPPEELEVETPSAVADPVES